MFNVVVQLQGYVYPGGLGDGSMQPETAQEWWNRLKQEFRILLCTKDKKYAGLRRRFSATVNKSQVALTSTISAAMAKPS